MKATFLRAIVPIAALTLFSACEKPNISRSEDGILFLGSYESSDVVERVIAPGQRSLVLEGFAGSIKLTGDDSDVARLRITRRTRADSPAEADTRLGKLQIEETGDATTFRYKFRTSEESLSRYDIEGTVPINAPLKIHWVSGDIDVEGLSADAEIRNRHGSVSYFGPAQHVRIRTRNGDATAVLTAAGATSDVNLATSNGNVSASLPLKASVHLEASTSAGSISTGTLAFASESYHPMDAGAKFQGRLAEGAGRIVISTEHGSVALSEYVPPVPVPVEAPGEHEVDEQAAAAPDTVIAAQENPPAGVSADTLR